jgi:hypothetical protein
VGGGEEQDENRGAARERAIIPLCWRSVIRAKAGECLLGGVSVVDESLTHRDQVGVGVCWIEGRREELARLQ